MKKIKWKILIITSVICLLPILLGLFYYNQLPDQVPIHFDINNEPDNYGSKEFAVFGLPIFMMIIQAVLCVISDISNKEENKYKITTIAKWIIPILTVILYFMTIGIALGYNNIDVRKIVCFCLGIIFILIGNYVPKVDQNMAYQTGLNLPNLYIKQLDEKNFRKISRITGYSYILLGILTIISLFFKPIYTLIVIGLIILVSIILTIYAFYLSKKDKDK